MKRRAAIALAALGLLLALAAPLTLISVESALETRLQEAAERRGWTISFRALDLGADLRCTLQDVAIKGPEGSSLTVSRIVATVPWRRLLDERPTPDHVHIQQLGGTLEANDLRRAQRGSGGGSTGGAATTLPRIDLDGAISVNGLPEPIGALALSGLKVQADDSGGSWRARFEARCDKGCGREPVGMTGHLTRDKGWRARADLDDHAVLAVPVPGMTDPLELGWKWVAVTRGDGLQIQLGELKTKVERGGWGASIKADRVEAQLVEGRPSGIILHAPTIDVRRLEPTPSTDEHAPAVDLKTQIQVRMRDFDPAPLKKWARRAVELAGIVEIRDGTVSAAGLTVEGFALGRQGESATIAGSWHGQWTLTLREDVLGADLAVEGADLAALSGMAGVGLGIRGHFDGQIRWRHGQTAPEPKIAARRAARIALTEALAHRLEIKGSLDQAGLSLSPLARAPVVLPKAGIELTLHAAHGTGPKAVDWWVLDPLTLTLTPQNGAGPVPVTFALEVRRALGKRAPFVAGTVSVPDVDCGDAISAIPRAMLPRLADHLSTKGRFAPALTFWVDMRDSESFDMRLKGLPGTCHITDLGPFDPIKWNRDDVVMEVTEGVTQTGIEIGPGTEDYVPITAMPRHVGAAAYMSEEVAFRTNKGFGLGLIKRALRMNLKEGRYVYGGSTVTQQLVKNLYMGRDKTLSRKLEEGLHRLEDGGGLEQGQDPGVVPQLHRVWAGSVWGGSGQPVLFWQASPRADADGELVSVRDQARAVVWAALQASRKDAFDRVVAGPDGADHGRLRDYGFISEETFLEAAPYVLEW